MNSAEMKLLPCPFCGGVSISLSEGTTFRWRYVGCDECGAQLEFRSDNRFEPTPETWADAAETWNRRALPSSANDIDECAKELCKIYFDIAAEVIGEDEVRKRRDAALSASEQG